MFFISKPLNAKNLKVSIQYKGGKYKSEIKAQLKTLYCLNLYKEFVPIIFGYMLPLV